MDTRGNQRHQKKNKYKNNSWLNVNQCTVTIEWTFAQPAMIIFIHGVM